MIYDRMERLAQYRGICPNLDTLIDHVLAHGVESYRPGRNEIDGDLCFLSGNVARLEAASDTYERHLRYVDLQIPLDEGEIITVRPVEELDWPAFEGETGFTHGAEGMRLDMRPGMFAVFFPGDAHNCGVSKAGQVQVRKLVGKALMR